jgi:hypothetical protein
MSTTVVGDHVKAFAGKTLYDSARARPVVGNTVQVNDRASVPAFSGTFPAFEIHINALEQDILTIARDWRRQVTT